MLPKDPHASACRVGMVSAAALSAKATKIATIAMFLRFIYSQSQISIIVYLNCSTTTANSIGEIVDIFKLSYIHYKHYGRNICSSIK